MHFFTVLPSDGLLADRAKTNNDCYMIKYNRETEMNVNKDKSS